MTVQPGRLSPRSAELSPFAVRHPAAPLLAAVLVVAASVLAMAWWTPYFETNDDVWFMLNTSGFTVPEPTPYVIWINLVLARLLVALSRLAGSIPWYGMLHAATVVAALAAVAGAVLVHGASPRRVGLLSVGFLVLGLPFVIEWQFTRLAMLASTGAVFLVIATLTEGPASRERAVLARLGTAVGLLLVGYLVRSRGFWLVVIVFTPLVLLLAWAGPRRRAASTGLALAAAGILIGSAWAVDASAYRTPDWRRYEKLNALKSEFLDFQHVPLDARTRPAIQAAGWSETDYRMLMMWFYVDPAVYSPERLAAIVTRTAGSGPSPLDRLAGGFRALFPEVAGSPFTWVAGALLLGGALLVVHGRATVVGLSITVLAAVGIMVGLLAFAKLPARIYEPVMAGLAWLPLVLGGERPVASASRAGTRIASLAGFLAVAVGVLVGLGHPAAPLRAAVERGRLAARDNQALRTALGRLPVGSPRTVVVVGAAFPYELILPLESKQYLRGLQIISVGASNQSPTQGRILAAHGIDDLARALFERADLAIALHQEYGEDRLLERYIAEHYGAEVRVAVWFHEGKLRLSRVVRSRAFPVRDARLAP